MRGWDGVIFGGLSLLILIGTVIVVIGGAFADEGREQFRRWRERYTGLANPHQSLPVRQCAARLISRHRSVRLETVNLLGDLNDNTAVPPLLQVLERYPDDAPLLECVVVSLEKLGDARALPALHSLAANHNISLMEAARRAIASIEPHGILLRGASAPASDSSALRRPLAAREETTPSALLRASSSAPNDPF